MIWNFRGRNLDLTQAKLMGVMNITPDSFSDGGSFFSPQDALKQAEKFISEGADILDLGAESTRPGADLISSEEQINRLMPVLKEIRKNFDIPISIDTTLSKVAEACLDVGADVVNDVSGFKDDSKMAQVVKQFQAGCVLMHRRGNAGNMQDLTEYENVVSEVLNECQESVGIALGVGIPKDSIVVDPGLGFAKKFEHNLAIMSELDQFVASGYPVLLGPSRKSFLGQITGRDVNEREFGTAACLAWGLERGVKIFRVHNVKDMKDIISVYSAIQNSNGSLLDNVRT